jgi:hypothetical protein
MNLPYLTILPQETYPLTYLTVVLLHDPHLMLLHATAHDFHSLLFK